MTPSDTNFLLSPNTCNNSFDFGAVFGETGWEIIDAQLNAQPVHK